MKWYEYLALALGGAFFLWLCPPLAVLYLLIVFVSWKDYQLEREK